MQNMGGINTMYDFKISYLGDDHISDVHHIGIDYNGNYYGIIFGKYANGGFCCLPGWGVGCELSDFDDVFWNSESLSKVIEDEALANTIVTAIKAYSELNQ